MVQVPESVTSEYPSTQLLNWIMNHSFNGWHMTGFGYTIYCPVTTLWVGSLASGSLVTGLHDGFHVYA